MFARQIRSNILLVWLLVVAGGLAAGAWTYFRERADCEAELIADAERGAIAFRHEELAALAGTPDDLNNPVYAEMRARLARLREVRPSARRISMLRYAPDTGQVFYLADSGFEGSRESPPPGCLVSGAMEIPAFRSVLRDGKPALALPNRSSSGDFVTAFALIEAGSDPALTVPCDVLRIDIPARQWERHLWSAAWNAAVAGWLLFGLPITGFLWFRHRSANAALIRKLYGAVEQSESAVMIVDLQGMIEYVNAGLCQQTGYVRDELVGRPWRNFKKDVASADPLAEVVARVRRGVSWEGQLTNRRKNGETYPARATVSPVRGRDGKIAGFIAVLADTSEAVRKEQELGAAKDQAVVADRAKGRFLATMSHEVRTPLNGIVGFASLLADTPLTPEQREYVQTIRTSGEALIQLTGDILDFSRIESGGLQLDTAPCDLRANLEDALDIFASKAAEKNVQLLHWIDPDVPEQVLIDGGRLRQVLINLVGNAVKFTPIGEVEVTVRLLTGKSVSFAPFEDIAKGQLVAEFADGAITLEFAVRDTGIGIADGDRAKLFQPFTQLDSSTVRRFGGTGLGLAISRNLVRLMGGDIHVESQSGRGSTFIFTVRTCSANASPSEGRLLYPLAKRTVAVSTPVPGLRAELVRLLRQAGALTVECGFEAVPRGGWDFAVVDCEAGAVRTFFGSQSDADWRADRAFGLVPVHLGTTERQELRRQFRILLNKPVHHRALLDLLAKAAASLEGGPAESGAALDLHVLVVEDDVVQQRVLKETCETLGCRCRVVDSGRAAIAELAVGEHDFVLMDLHMAEVDGLTALKQIRAGEAGEAMREVWVAIITGDTRAEVADMAFAAGADDFLSKPVHLSDLEAAARRHLAERRRLVRKA